MVYRLLLGIVIKGSEIWITFPKCLSFFFFPGFIHHYLQFFIRVKTQTSCVGTVLQYPENVAFKFDYCCMNGLRL